MAKKVKRYFTIFGGGGENMMNEFKTIRQTATSGILPEKELRSRLARGALPHIKTGNRVYVNIPLLRDLLNAESVSSLEGGEVSGKN